MRTSRSRPHGILEKLRTLRFEVLQISFDGVHSRGAHLRERTLLMSVQRVRHVPPSLGAVGGRSLQSSFQLRTRVTSLRDLCLHALQRALKAFDDAVQC